MIFVWGIPWQASGDTFFWNGNGGGINPIPTNLYYRQRRHRRSAWVARHYA